jgi:general secretion pathway protein A
VYSEFYGLSERPFDLTLDLRFLFLSGPHREALSNLEYGITGRKGFTLLLGDAGLGKTTLIHTVLGMQLNHDTKVVHISNPTLSRTEFFRTLAAGFGLSDRAASDKSVFLKELEDRLRDRFAAGALTILVIDEAQSLPHDLLEEIRLLGNIETQTEKLLPVVLAGQPELSERLNETSLRQLKQRIALRCELRPLSLSDCAAYVAARLRIAGGKPREIFTRDAIQAVHAASKGVPRAVNVLCDNALIAGFARGERPVGRTILEEVCRDFDVLLPIAPEPKAVDSLNGSSVSKPVSLRTPTAAPVAGAANTEAPGTERSIFGGLSGRRWVPMVSKGSTSL